MIHARRRRAVLAAVALAGFTCSSQQSRANGRFPASNMLVAQPGDPSHLVLRATYGLLFSSDGGGSWDWVCEKAVGYGGAEDPTVTVTKSGAVVVGMFHGMARSTDGGCTWEHDAKWPQSVVDLTLRKSAPRRVYAATCVFSRVADAGGSLFKNAVEVSDDEGESWTAKATLDPTILVDSVEVAESDASRVYVSAIRPRGHETAGVLLVSDDDGAHFQERPVPFEPTDRGIYIAAVDPKNASRVYLRTTGIDSGRLLVTEDAGKSFREAQRGGPIPAFALADDGATIYAGGPKDGLVRYAAGLVGSAEKQSATAIQCLASIGPTLWACAPVGAGFVLGASTNGGSTFAPKLTLAGMRGPLRCADGVSVAATCAADWATLEALVNPRLDAPKDAGGPARPGPSATTASSSCGCATVGAPLESGGRLALFSLVVALAAVVLHRRRATVPRPWRLAARGRRRGGERLRSRAVRRP